MCSDCWLRLGMPAHCAQRRQASWDAVRQLRAEGLLNYEIAERLGFTASKVSTIVHRMRKAGVEVAESSYDRRSWDRRMVAR